MSQSENDELFQNYKAELEQLEKAGFQIHISLKPVLAVSIISALQLALRHPNFKGPVSVIVFNFIRMLSDEFKGRAPFTAEVIRRGGLREYDQPVKRHPKKGGNHADP
jgi:hypothetical protein